jgi:5-oxoprolinase (ATP-hydrolysing)
MHGGEDGANGRNFWARKVRDGEGEVGENGDGFKWIQLPPRGLVEMDAGDRCVVHTPSGGGWGTPVEGVAGNGNSIGKVGDGVKEQEPRAAGSYHNFLSAQAAGS